MTPPPLPAATLIGPWRPCRNTFTHLRTHAPATLLHLIAAQQLGTAHLSWAAEEAGHITTLPAGAIVAAIKPLLAHGTPVVREGAVYGLQPFLHRLDAWAAVVTLARSDPSPTIREVAAEALLEHLDGQNQTWFIRPWRPCSATFDYLAAHAPDDLLGYLTLGWLSHVNLAYAALAARDCPDTRLTGALCTLLTHPRAYVVEGALRGLAPHLHLPGVRAAIRAAQPHPCPVAQRLLSAQT
ncbi:hypothetical protein [Deinococcus soli (ex Cha et al. 2016)]|uniref:HEAT repeat domain-containing protein n=2 Tax=Deinococcus soli (ex Cha et al. 2016) TaxID=1309411 RepID=A0AAE4BLI9_9DEIO|nr:hypothetical protein [Deinococcus soli (ex Cha et al. 2016)]MDR6219033.1 hypothetical protein [Deinococcus soli (ex Cha et al. 2016)]MDR6328830.1 hypothetical protein [Deinococcus soli (ex Cha et al. 2016)]MDR6751682.1 hypothetical protein [Deinococcus soli (ex Cha et al. 2016)]